MITPAHDMRADAKFVQALARHWVRLAQTARQPQPKGNTARAPRNAPGRLIFGIDGRSGAGKTTLAGRIQREMEKLASPALATATGGAQPAATGEAQPATTKEAHPAATGEAQPGLGLRVLAVELENYIAGWHGLVAGTARVAAHMLDPFSRQGFFELQPWDWHLQNWAATGAMRKPVRGTADVLLLIGCGSTSQACAPYLTESVWVTEPVATRRARVTQREGDPSSWWDIWAAQETELLQARYSPDFATYVVRPES
ncbi:hypothetical protein [Actinobaculum suis]|uniref:hypothetical protein n=1 Tax=Actinobaculum suis TaxID=1657 RepID=UPI00080880CA|nr:hypothetical protein [Actinobaculum suis]OCA93730.1 hypothetical protein ACU20_07710 [Actinobaculum suis]OCA94023.1 hypothetical protein ACU21_07665 [Actinobaculum suis]